MFANTDASLADQEIAFRACRIKHFPACLFADPAWDMLLELYCAHLRQYRVSVSGLCIASQVPATTALRWISTLESQNLISRKPDPLDHRRVHIQLTADGLIAYFSDAAARGATQAHKEMGRKSVIAVTSRAFCRAP